MWWKLYRHAEARWVMSLPFYIYAVAIFGMGVAEMPLFAAHRTNIGFLSAFLYTSAASSSSFYLTENFGHEVGSQVSEWVFRAYFIRGIQQVYFSGLWKIGSQPPPTTVEYLALDGSYYNGWLPYITTPAAISIFLIGTALFKGLPSCYRAIPPSMPAFAPAMMRRRTILVGVPEILPSSTITNICSGFY
jgi:alpha-1,3-glucan synthase